MKLFKQIDLGLQLLIILACGVSTLLYKDFLLTACFIIIGYQSLSAISHVFLQRHYQQLKARSTYNILLVVSVLFSPCFLIFLPALIYIVFLIASPFLILWYVYICYEEKKRLEYKEFVHLK